MNTLKVDLQIATETSSVPPLEKIQVWAETGLVTEGQREVTIRIVDEEEGRGLNHEYRGKDYPTNVLSFPFECDVEMDIPLLGDLVICAAVVEREAGEQNKPVEPHWAHLIMHGMLHLQGYTHENDDEAAIMESKEIELMKTLGFSNPYANS